MKVDVDDGRVYLPKETRKKYGTKFRVVETDEGLLFVPLTDDSLSKLREITSGTNKSSKEIVEEAREAMIEEAGN